MKILVDTDNADLLQMAANRTVEVVFTDKTPIPFGKHKGTSLGNVPASYLLWWLDEGSKEDFPALRQYVLKNQRALEIEASEEEDYKYYEEY